MPSFTPSAKRLVYQNRQVFSQAGDSKCVRDAMSGEKGDAMRQEVPKKPKTPEEIVL